ncbi:MAG TPA: carboxylating nicotinate-nucleotide diphosphorylase [Candidatus Krumholzibacteria bacterium]
MTAIDPLRMDLVRERVRAALEEDGAGRDVTTGFLGLGKRTVVADIRGAEVLVACGIEVAREVFRQVDASCRFDARCEDGARVATDAPLCTIEGSAASIVAAERTALNFLQRMCGVATLASRYVDAVSGTGVVILDTRKTIPLWRELDKYAVRCGGAHNHRRSLDAMVLVKDNHIRALGGTDALVARLAGASHDGFVEVEVESLDMLRRVADGRVDRIMLDNFTPAQVGEAMDWVRAFRTSHPQRRIEIEVSGGVTLETVRDYAQPGVDFISVGAITHSAPAAPLSLGVR